MFCFQLHITSFVSGSFGTCCACLLESALYDVTMGQNTDFTQLTDSTMAQVLALTVENQHVFASLTTCVKAN